MSSALNPPTRGARRGRRTRFGTPDTAGGSAPTVPLPVTPRAKAAGAAVARSARGQAPVAAAAASLAQPVQLHLPEVAARTPVSAPMSVRELLADLRDVLAPAAHDQGVDLAVSVEPRVPEQVLGDPTRLAQVLFNLVGNAIKFSGDRPGQRGQVQVLAALGAGQPPALEFVVIDNGIGMGVEMLKRLATPAAGPAPSMGAGVGLAVCRRLAAQMGGRISAASTLCEGSTFTLTVPAQPVEAAREPAAETDAVASAEAVAAARTPRHPAPAPAAAPHRGDPILLAEDDEFNARMIVRQVELLGHAVEVARDGYEALRMWRSGRYALLLTDLRMPRMDGCELAHTIRTEELAAGAPRRPILAVTAHAELGRTERAQASGIDEYLTKPLPLQKLHLALKHWLATSAESAADEKTFDLKTLRERIGDDPTIVRDFLLRFSSAARRLAKRAHAATKARDLRRAQVVGQQLGYWAKSIGAATLDSRCDAVENAALVGDEAAAWQAMTPMLAALLQVEAEVSALLQ